MLLALLTLLLGSTCDNGRLLVGYTAQPMQAPAETAPSDISLTESDATPYPVYVTTQAESLNSKPSLVEIFASPEIGDTRWQRTSNGKASAFYHYNASYPSDLALKFPKNETSVAMLTYRQRIPGRSCITFDIWGEGGMDWHRYQIQYSLDSITWTPIADQETINRTYTSSSQNISVTLPTDNEAYFRFVTVPHQSGYSTDYLLFIDNVRIYHYSWQYSNYYTDCQIPRPHLPEDPEQDPTPAPTPCRNCFPITIPAP